jgi:hypothetical protein
MKVQVVLNLGSTNDVQVCVDADVYNNGITASTNPNFVAPAVSAPVAAMLAAQVTITRTSVTALRTAIAAATSDVRTDNIRSARTVVDSNLSMLANLVEIVANAPTVLDMNREGIVHSAGMRIKAHVNRTQVVFAVVNLEPSGTVHLVAPGGVAAHLWEYTADTVNFSNRQAVEPTTVANTDITGLSAGTRYAFFHRAISTAGPQPWDGPEFLVVT